MTEKEKNILNYLRASVADGIFPTVREICENTGIASTSTAAAALSSLEKQGHIRIKRGKSRGIYLTEANITLVPLLGETEGKSVPFPQGGVTEVFAVRATDNIGEIKAGDIVFFKGCYIAPPDTIAAFESHEGVIVGAVGKTDGAIIGRVIGFTRML